MKDLNKYVQSPEEMVALGEELSQSLKAGAVIALKGDLGAGKTHLTKGLTSGLGCDAEVTSPTFSLAHEYTGGRLSVFHFDFYRMEKEEEVLGIGWDEYLDAADEGGVIIVEWPDKFSSLLPDSAFWLEVLHEGAGRLVQSIQSKKL